MEVLHNHLLCYLPVWIWTRTFLCEGSDYESIGNESEEVVKTVQSYLKGRVKSPFLLKWVSHGHSGSRTHHGTVRPLRSSFVASTSETVRDESDSCLGGLASPSTRSVRNNSVTPFPVLCVGYLSLVVSEIFPPLSWTDEKETYLITSYWMSSDICYSGKPVYTVSRIVVYCLDVGKPKYGTDGVESNAPQKPKDVPLCYVEIKSLRG